MEPDRDSAFRPRRLPPHDLRTPMRAAEARLPGPVRDERHGTRLAQAERFDPLGNRAVRRTRAYVLGAVIFLPLLNAFFSPLGFGALGVQVTVAAAYGVAVAALRPRWVAGGLLLVLAGSLTMLLAGIRPIGVDVIWAYLAWMSAGTAVGVQEEMKAMDGE
jgi:hypothetical protein